MKAKDYKKGLKIALKRIKTKKSLNQSQYKLLKTIKNFLNTKTFNLENFDFHLKHNTKEYKKLIRLNIRFNIFSSALDNHILTNFIPLQYRNIKGGV